MRACSRRVANGRCCAVASRPAASRGSRRSTAPHLAAALNWRSPAIAASPPTTRAPGSGCRRSRSDCFPVPGGHLVKAAKEWIKSGGTAKAPWDVEGFRLPGGPVYSKAGMMVFPPANAIYRRETYDNYPAARAIMQVVYEGLQLPMDAALRVESRWFAKTLRSPEAAAMIRSLFVSMQDLNRGMRRPANV